jgi:hypothetical protein
VPDEDSALRLLIAIAASGRILAARQMNTKMQYTPDAALAALSNDDLVSLFATQSWPIWQVSYVLASRGSHMIDAALRGLTHPHPQVRRSCAELMDHYGDDRCIEPLLALMDDSVAHVRWQAVHSLSCQRCKLIPLDVRRHVTDRMIELLMNDPCTRVRAAALAAIELRPDAATPDVIDALRDFEADLAARPVLSKRERAFLRGVRRALHTSTDRTANPAPVFRANPHAGASPPAEGVLSAFM